jgi:hypothetical protein
MGELEPLIILQTRSLHKNGVMVSQWLVQLENLSLDEASWEDADFIKVVFPTLFADTVKS